MPSIVNGLFAGRSGISSHGIAIAVVGDNISNASTTGYKTSRSEFADIIAGGQGSGKTVGAGSSTSAVTTIFEQGTLEFTGRPLDLAVDGNGFFVLDDNGQRFYSRAGNFKVDESGFLINQEGLGVLGFPDGGSGALEPININTISQSQVRTLNVEIAGNVDAGAPAIDVDATPTITGVSLHGTSGSTTTYSELSNLAEFSTVVDVFDSLGQKHTVTVMFYKDDNGAALQNTYRAIGYVPSDDVDDLPAASGLPRELFDITLTFDQDGSLSAGSAQEVTATNIQWNNGSDQAQDIDFNFSTFTQYSSPSNILSITQDGKGIGTVGSVSIERDGTIFALLDNGQAASIGRIGLVNFSNAEGLVRVGGNLLQQSPSSGEPVIGRPETGTFGAVQSGSLELSTVDIATEFVKLITLQRGFQANSRIITTINQLLNDIIQLA